MMKFFEMLATLAKDNKVELQVGITVEKDAVAVTVVPKSTNKVWPPFLMTGKPDELDDDFETQMNSLQEALGIISNAATYAATVKKEAEKKPADITNKKTEAPAKKEDKKPEPKKEKPKPPEPEKDEEDESMSLFD